MKTSKKFDLTVYLFRRPFMRCEALEMEMYMGQSQLKTMFDDERVDESVTSLFLSFPERWMNIVEERSLYPRIEKYLPNCKEVTIKTQSVYILQSTHAEDIKIVADEEERTYTALTGILPQECVEGKMYFPNSMNVIKSDGLTVVTGQ